MAQTETQPPMQECPSSGERPEPSGIVIFGASGDLTHRKLIPSLFSLYRRGHLPESFYILGCARSLYDDTNFRDAVRLGLENDLGKEDGASAGKIDSFLERCHYLAGEYGDLALYTALQERLKTLDRQFGTTGNRLFYLSTPPSLYASIVEHLGFIGLTGQEEGRWARVVIEKPFGRDLASAKALNADLNKSLEESQIYRIDHYLGKETVQNILMLRFANSIFEPLWNNRYIDHVQITVAESLGVEHRAGYFEQAGLMRDMFQNHLIQMLTLVAMEPPISFESNRIRDERVKLIRSIRPFPLDALHRWVVRGQYGPGEVGGGTVKGYREERGVAPDSRVETFVAAKVMIENWRWKEVPFYLRTGKRMATKATEIVIAFKKVPHLIFSPLKSEDLIPNILCLNVQPEEGISLTIQAKPPGHKVCLSTLNLDFSYQEVFGAGPPEAYERLLLDAMLGDPSLYWRQDGVEASWSLVTPVLDAWDEDGSGTPLELYRSGSWGPDAAAELIEGDRRCWKTPLVSIRSGVRCAELQGDGES